MKVVPSSENLRHKDSKITLDSIRSTKNHNHHVEEWKIEFKWVKAHAGIYGNEIAV
jgi:ribonuclease HI